MPYEELILNVPDNLRRRMVEVMGLYKPPLTDEEWEIAKSHNHFPNWPEDFDAAKILLDEMGEAGSWELKYDGGLYHFRFYNLMSHPKKHSTYCVECEPNHDFNFMSHEVAAYAISRTWLIWAALYSKEYEEFNRELRLEHGYVIKEA